MAYDEHLASRIRELIGADPDVTGQLASGCGRRSRSQPVAPHDVADPREVGWPAARIGEHSGDFAEVGRAEHSRRDDRKRLRVHVAAVIEMMDRAARYAQ